MFKRGQKDHNVIKGSLENKRKQRKKRKQNETKIEIEINENQINNTNYDVQSCNDDEASNSKRINDEEDFDQNHDNGEEKEREDDNGEETDSELPDLCNRIDADGASDSDSDSDRDSNNDNDEEQKQRNQVDPMKVKFGFLNGTKGIYEDKNNNDNRKKTRKMGKSLFDRVVGMFKGDESEVNKPTQYQRVTKNKSSYKNKDIKYKNNKKKRKKGKSRVQIPRESDDEYSSEEDDDENVSGLPGIQERYQLDSGNENDDNNNNSEVINDRSDSEDVLDNESCDRYYEIPHALKSKSNTGESIDTDDYNEYGYDGDSDTSSSCDSPWLGPKNTTSPSATPRKKPSIEPTKNGKPRVEPRLGESPRSKSRLLQNEIKALPG